MFEWFKSLFSKKKNDDLIFINATLDLEHWIKNTAKYYEETLRHEIWQMRYENSGYFVEASNICSFSINIYPKRINYKECFDKCDDDCPICLETIGKKRHAKTEGCNHHFHIKCLNEYVTSQLESGNLACCPLCRGGVEINHLKTIDRIKSYVNTIENEYDDSDSD